jgi:N-formylglutamate amidohydrolase
LPAVQKLQQEPLFWFASIEGAGDSWHVHGLIRAPRPLNSSLLAAAWKRGFQRVNRYDPSRGYAAYATKSLATESGFFDVSEPLAKRHRTRRSRRRRKQEPNG